MIRWNTTISRSWICIHNQKNSTDCKMVGSNGNLDFLARLTWGCGHKEQRCKRKWLQIFAVFSSAQVYSERNNKFLMSDLDTLLRDAYGRFALLLAAFPFVWKRNTACSRTEEESHSSQSTGANGNEDFALFLFHIYLYVVVIGRKGVWGSSATRVSREEESYFRFSGRSAWESRRWIESPREQSWLLASPQGCPCFM